MSTSDTMANLFVDGLTKITKQIEDLHGRPVDIEHREDSVTVRSEGIVLGVITWALEVDPVRYRFIFKPKNPLK